MTEPDEPFASFLRTAQQLEQLLLSFGVPPEDARAERTRAAVDRARERLADLGDGDDPLLAELEEQANVIGAARDEALRHAALLERMAAGAQAAEMRARIGLPPRPPDPPGITEG